MTTSRMKANSGLAKLLPLIELIGREGLLPRNRTHRCGHCYKVDHPTDSHNTVHTVFKLPTGSEIYICQMCGSAVIYEDDDDKERESDKRREALGKIRYARSLRLSKERQENGI